jgi:hypothetical protein
VHHPQKPALQEFNHSLQEFNQSLWFRRWSSAPSTKTCASRVQSFASRIQSVALVSTVVQCTIHKNLRFKNSITRFKNTISRASLDGGPVHHPQQPALQEFNYSFLFGQWYSAPSTKTCASRIQSLVFLHGQVTNQSEQQQIVHVTNQSEQGQVTNQSEQQQQHLKSEQVANQIVQGQVVNQSEQQQQQIETERTGSYGYSDNSYSKRCQLAGQYLNPSVLLVF